MPRCFDADIEPPDTPLTPPGFDYAGYAFAFFAISPGCWLMLPDDFQLRRLSFR